jgi:hypothetical protein
MTVARFHQPATPRVVSQKTASKSAMLRRDRHLQAGWRLQMASATILFDRGGDRAKQGTTEPTGGWLTSILEMSALG